MRRFRQTQLMAQVICNNTQGFSSVFKEKTLDYQHLWKSTKGILQKYSCRLTVFYKILVHYTYQ